MHASTYGLIPAAGLTLAMAMVPLPSPATRSLLDQADEFLRARIEMASVPPKITVGEELIHASVALPLFYERRVYKPAWSGDLGLLPQIEALIRAISQADREGFRSTDYHLSRIETILKEVRQNQEKGDSPGLPRLVDLDLLLTDAFLIYASHLLVGRVNPETVDPEWVANRREADFASVLQTALDSSQIEECLEKLLPPQPGYERLKQGLSHYRNIATKGGWPSVPEGAKMEKGDRGPRIAALRSRLIASGELDPQLNMDEELFGDALEQAVIRFQKQHGLDPDGLVGPKTLAALNVPAEERLQQIEVNMERWRWLPQDLGQRYVLVNIANFELEVIEKGRQVMKMRAVVGKYYRRTPVFSDRITYLVLSPYWHVPPRIAVEDKLPLIRKDPSYLVQEDIKLFQGWGAETKEIDPRTIDWSKVSARNFNYRLRQEPGPKNALGRVKFMFPNKFDVYLHDTPSRVLFTKTVRTFSSGCIRIEKPIELAEYLLQRDPKWNRESIMAAIEKRVEQTVKLPEPVSIHLLYWTAWVNEEGTVQFRDDIYGRDKLVREALAEKPPTSTNTQ